MSNEGGDNPDELLQEEGEDGLDAGDEDEPTVFEESGDFRQDSLNDDSILLNETNEHDDTADDESFEQIKLRMKEFEEEANKLKAFTDSVESEMKKEQPNPSAAHPATPNLTYLSPEEKREIDIRSIYIGNVDYGATAAELEAHFHGCGAINRVTINCDKFSGHPKGFAYIEFTDAESIEPAEALDESLFRGRQISVKPKRTNIHGHSTTNRPPRGRGRGGFRGRGGYRGGYRARSPFSSYRGAYRGRGRASHYTPY